MGGGESVSSQLFNDMTEKRGLSTRMRFFLKTPIFVLFCVVCPGKPIKMESGPGRAVPGEMLNGSDKNVTLGYKTDKMRDDAIRLGTVVGEKGQTGVAAAAHEVV